MRRAGATNVGCNVGEEMEKCSRRQRERSTPPGFSSPGGERDPGINTASLRWPAAARLPRRRLLASSETKASARTTMIVDNQMCVQVQGEDISPEEYHNEAGWTLAGERMSRLRQRTPASGKPDGPGGSQTSPKSKCNKNVRASVIKAAGMPAMTLEESKIVVRPRGGLDIVKTGTTTVASAILAAAKIKSEESAADTICPNTQQNIMVVSTPNGDNAARYATIKEISLQDKPYEVSAYRTAPHDTVKGVIRGIPIDASADELDRNIVNERNPLAVGAKRIGSTTTVIVAFQGPKIPNFVRYGVTLLPCHLYRKQIDVCHQCGRVGHRKDVYPTPTIMTCLACGLVNPKQDHPCTPKCKMCGGEHPTGDRTCKAKYKISYVVRKRQWERRQAEHQLMSESDFPPLDKPPDARNSRTPSKTRAPKSRDSSCCKRTLSRTRSPPRERVGWVDAVKGNNKKSTPKNTDAAKKDDLNEVREANETLRQENLALRKTANNLTREIAEIRKLLICNNESLQRPTSSTSKAEETTTNNQETDVTEPALKKRAVETTRKKKEHDRIDNPDTKFEARFTKLEELITENIAANMNRFAFIEKTLQPIVSHPTFALLFEQHSPNQEALYAPTQLWPPAQQQQQRKAVIQQHITHAARKPDVILLQETLTDAPFLPGYRVHRGPPDGRGLCTLVRKGLTFVEHELHNNSKIEHTLTEIIPGKKRKGSIFLLNVYSNPSQRKQIFKTLLHRAITAAGRNTLLVCGDINAMNPAWGYNKYTAKGRDLYLDATELDFILITDPTHPTRIGNSVSRDTTPDLTFVKNDARGAITWRNTGADLGSDHTVVEISIPEHNDTSTRTHRWIDWDAFRDARNQKRDGDDEIEDIDFVHDATKELETDAEIDKVDSRLAHLIEAKQLILNRWKKHRLNRRLRKKVAEFNREIEDHCRVLCLQQWNEICNAADGQMHSGMTWNLLRHLLDETKTKSHQRDRLAKLIHWAVSVHGADEVTRRTIDKYLPTTLTEQHAPYGGLPNEKLDRDIDIEEVRAALHDLNSRWQDYLEREGLYPATAIGFRRHLSTQDAMLQLKSRIIDDSGNARDNKAILGLDLQSAFDRVKHSAILSQVSKLNMGERSYNYIKDFLTDRIAELRAGDLQTQERELGSTGTPQGSVISPTLFNLVMIGVAEKLADIENVRHTIYADDITLWVTGGSDAHIESALQAAVDAIENQLEGTGLECSPSKSELLIIHPTNNGRGKTRQREYEKIRIVTKSGNVIPEVGKIRILGMVIEKHRRNGETVARLTAKAANATRLLKRVTSRKAGMREESLIRLVQSFIISYVAVYKTALGLFESTSTARFLQLGIHNALEEIAEAQRTAQLERLSTTKTGRRVLDDLGIGHSNETETKLPVREEVRSQTRIDPIPKNMNPDYNKGRRAARAEALIDLHANDEHARYVDAAAYQRNAFAAVVIEPSTGATRTAASVRSAGAEQAEELAIALAIAKSAGRPKRVLRAVSLQDRKVRIKWFPAHAGDASEGNDNHNEKAHAAARALTDRAPATDRPTWFEAKDRMTDYNDISEGPPHGSQDSSTPAPAAEQLQTGSLPSPGLMHRMYPETNPTDRCKFCRRETADHTHILWDCIKHPEEARSRTILPRLEAAAKSYDQGQQLWPVQQVLGALERQGPGEPTTASRDPRRVTATAKTT
ncbi:hypothetical protein HPB47_013748 [Ixodes persulcatus]|uniref:Uncharacterized protein n=1 Tax=Ixodes persulcatus TaxID=34615 RepID=A0AC60QXY6_IXOPE|nr:hypothetical protein HPB47_013748 [Ixodes persulcatus]